MFKSYEFTYAGMPASMFGMYIADMSSNKHSANSFGNKANLVETRLANRVAPIHYGVRYNDSPLSFTLIFGADHKLDRYEMQAVSKWLTGYQEYQWLSIDQPDMEHIQFRCLVQELTPIHLSWVPMAFEAKIICDCPYGYSLGDGSNAIGIETSEPETIAEKKLQIGNAIEMFYELVVETISLFAVSNDAEILMTLNAGMKRYRLLSDLDDKTLAEIDDMTLEELDFVVLA